MVTFLLDHSVYTNKFTPDRLVLLW